jgi:hypothetical protein
MEHELERLTDGVAVLRVRGDVDVSHALVLRGVLGDLLAEEAPACWSTAATSASSTAPVSGCS